MNDSLGVQVSSPIPCTMPLPPPPHEQFIQCFGCLNVTVMLAIILYVVIENVGLPSSEGDAPPDPSS